MQITKKFCAVTLIHSGLWMFFFVFCHTSLAASAGIDHGRSLPGGGGGSESAEIISGRPKIIYGTTRESHCNLAEEELRVELVMEVEINHQSLL